MVAVRRINVFISSAMTELEYDREIVQQALLEMNVNPVLFEVFPAMSQSPSESYLDEVRNCDIFAILLWKSLRPAVLKEYTEALVWNKPILIFVKSLIDNEERESELKNFLSELMARSQQYVIRRTTYKRYRSISDLRTAIRESIAAEIAKFYREPISTLNREEMYQLGTSIIRYAQKRLYLFQRTPSIILGARDYLANDKTKYSYEKEFVDTLFLWITENYMNPNKELLYLFSADATRKEIEEKSLAQNKTYIDKLKESINDLKEIEANSAFRFRIRIIDVPISGPLIIGDNRYAFWLLGSDQAVSISQENEKICDILVRMLKTCSQRSLSEEDICHALGVS
ncbi:MAG: DUF4062 domain-containing protein [Proteobacteria bacterium]|nr:DUF4062 domain-containing protein [Pseudomonadota bacterium]